MNMLAPVNHIIGLTSIVRERLLPIEGTVTARLNQRVSSMDVIAETSWSREHVLLDVARKLRVHPLTAEKLIKCKAGDQLAANAEIAVSNGMFQRVVRAPREGRVAAVGGGQVLMDVAVTKIELRAGIPGMIVEIIPNRGAVIQTTGALIQGVWGNGKIDSGLLVNLMEGPESVLSSGRLDVSLRGSILLVGMVKDAETLRFAGEMPVRGLILSSLFPSLLPVAREMRYPILVTDGFGSMPMNSAAYRLLSTNAKREITVNAEMYNRYSGAIPEAIIPLPVATDAPSTRESEIFAPGLQVRMRRPPAMGAIGTLVALKPGLTTLPSGLRAPAADVRLETGEMIVAPLVNIEVVG